jgi:deferrochelatase/peroxidase EfeB
MNAPAPGVELDDIQGLLRFGYKHHTESCFVLLRVKNRAAARAWLAQAPVLGAAARDRPPATVLQVAFTSQGLRALGLADDLVDGFSPEFVAGMTGSDNRERRLGDVGANSPRHWRWGGDACLPDVLLLLYARPGRLAGWRAELEAQYADGLDCVANLPCADLRGAEPFGFADGISQPQPDWERRRTPYDQESEAYSNLSCLGEFVLGYPNEYGNYTDRPLLDPARPAAALLARAEDAPGLADLGRNGSYLVLRQLRQDVDGFWRFLDRQAGGDPVVRQRLAETMVGRTLQGEPLVGRGGEPRAGTGAPREAGQNDFTYRSDPHGVRCPLGAHIRRVNPRNADLPPGAPGPVSWVLRTLGFDRDALAQDLVSSTRFHRLLRRGREYGAAMAPSQPRNGPGAGEQGLYFICLNGNLARQFEFVQGAWVAAPRFNGLTESDPLLGTRLPGLDASPTDAFSIPQADGPDQRLDGLPQFVQVVGGAYFFLPGIRALRYLATAT